MNERTPPPKLENIKKGIKFSLTPCTTCGTNRSRLVASLHVASSVWISDSELKKHPEIRRMIEEKLALHLLRQLYHNQIAEMNDAVCDFMRGWTPGPLTMDGKGPFDIKDRLLKLALFTPPAGFDDDETDCDRGQNCGCEQFQFALDFSKS